MTELLKVAILIIAAKQVPTKEELSTTGKIIYKGLDVNKGPEMMERWQHERSVWQAYMNIHPQIDCYFLQADETQEQPVKIEKNLISIKTTDSFIPGIYIKTCKALEALQGKYDFYIRTSLSSVFNFDRLLGCLLQLPRRQFYGGPLGVVHRDDPVRRPRLHKLLYKLSGGHLTPFFPKPTTVIGYCIVLSEDVVSHLVSSYQRYREYKIPDDHLIAATLESDWHIQAQGPPNFFRALGDLPYRDVVEFFAKNEPQDCCFRLKSRKGQPSSNSKAIALFLLKRFYGISLP